ncbi:MAG: hypothetical protein L0H93_02960 [Nocardioides sp.]|nr:hypothetical protein [Nocardioides sp.]
MKFVSGAMILLTPLVMVAGPVAAGESKCHTKTVTTFYLGEPRTQTKLVCTQIGETEDSGTTTGSAPGLPTELRGSSSDLDCPGIFLHLAATGGWVKVAQGCPPQGQAPVITAGMIMNRFRDSPIPVARIVVQPPGGKTLVNFDTIFQTEAEGFTESFRLLGQTIDLKITPATYTWLPGDGSSFQTSEPGIAYEKGRPMSDYVSHSYEVADSVHPRVDVTWTAVFRVSGGAWQPVTGSVTKQGTPADLQVVEGKPVLVNGY